jgi:hypothetical protein
MALFNNFSSKGKLNFYKIEDDQDTLTVSIGIASNHQIKESIYDNIEKFLTNLLIKDYMNEDTHDTHVEEQKFIQAEVKKQEKQMEKQRKDIDKQRKLKAKETKKNAIAEKKLMDKYK